MDVSSYQRGTTKCQVSPLSLTLAERMDGFERMNIVFTFVVPLQEAKTGIGIGKSLWAGDSSAAGTPCPLYSKDDHGEEEIRGGGRGGEKEVRTDPDLLAQLVIKEALSSHCIMQAKISASYR